jgi:non-heme Fe2+,alpha-ketoglutarate-dependent halogenase
MKTLSPEGVAQYRRDGFYFPHRVLSSEEAAGYRARLEAIERERGGPLGGELRHKGHLLFTWLDRLIRHPRIVDAVEDILGPNLLCWSSSFFIKEARDPAFVSWQQEWTFWGLSEPDVVTAWVALSESSIESGAMRMIPGTHTEQVAHRDTFAPENLLSRGQEIMVEVDEARAVDVVLHPGEMSLHHVRMFHGSPPNRSADRRIGYAIRYIPTHVRQVAGPRDTATLVRGVDAYQHFDHEEAPAADLDASARARHAAIMKRQGDLLYRGTTAERFR